MYKSRESETRIRDSLRVFRVVSLTGARQVGKTTPIIIRGRGAQASAALYSAIESAKATGHESYWYLRFLFQGLISARTAEQYAALLP